MGYPYSKKYFIDCLKSKPSGVSWVCLWVPTLTPKVPFLARVSREGLTADNHSVILNSVVIVVNVGAAASVKELLIATVVGVTAPEGVEMGRQMQAGSPPPQNQAETLDHLFQSLTVSPSDCSPERDSYTPNVTQQSRTGTGVLYSCP